MSRLALVALDVFDGIGVYWGNASVCNWRETFEGFCVVQRIASLPIRFGGLDPRSTPCRAFRDKCIRHGVAIGIRHRPLNREGTTRIALVGLRPLCKRKTNVASEASTVDDLRRNMDHSSACRGEFCTTHILWHLPHKPTTPTISCMSRVRVPSPAL